MLKCLAVLQAAVFAVGIHASAAMAEDLTLMFGKPDGEHAEIILSPDKSSDRALVIKTRLVGVAGSRLFLNTDGGTKPLFERILTEDECKFVDNGSVCEVAIAGGTRLYKEAVYAFKRARVLHVGVETAGSMAMSEKVSLKGFTKAYNKL